MTCTAHGINCIARNEMEGVLQTMGHMDIEEGRGEKASMPPVGPGQSVFLPAFQVPFALPWHLPRQVAVR